MWNIHQKDFNAAAVGWWSDSLATHLHQGHSNAISITLAHNAHRHQYSHDVCAAFRLFSCSGACSASVSSLSEAEAHWRTFLQSLQARGLSGVQRVVADDHAGLKKARTAVFPSVPWQRCQFHLQQNAQAYVPRLEMRNEVAQALRAVFTAPHRAEAERLLKLGIATYEKTAPQLAQWMEANVPEGLTIFELPLEHRVRCRSIATYWTYKHGCAFRVNRRECEA